MMNSALPVSAVPSASAWLTDYRPPNGAYDEMREPNGAIRPAWQPLIDSLGEIDRLTLVSRWEQARRVIRENGVTYNVHGDPAGCRGPGSWTPCRCSSPAAEWSKIAAGLAQRATLLNLILEDLYGPQRLLAEGLLPPELVFLNPGFLRPCHGLSIPKGRYLYLYAGHLARDEAGQLARRWPTRPAGRRARATPSRIASSSRGCCPTFFAIRQVERLARFFLTMRDTLQNLAANARHAADRAAQSRPDQSDLFRRRLPRPLSWLRAGRGRRPDGSRQPGLSENARRALPKSM